MLDFGGYHPAVLPVTEWEYLQWSPSEIFNHDLGKPKPKKLEAQRSFDGKQLLNEKGDGKGLEDVLKENILFEDLASLTYTDFTMLGFTNDMDIYKLMDLISKLINQNPSYTDICENIASDVYNQQIFKNCYWHLEALRSALCVTNCKLQINPPKDILVSEKQYASCLSLHILDQLCQNVDETIQIVLSMQKENSVLAKSYFPNRRIHSSNTKPSKKIKFGSALLFASLSGLLIVLFYDKFRFKP